ncbi:MAG: DUF502 domain-containing protein [Lysobacterales bacterium]
MRPPRLRRYLLTGLLTLLPVGLTVLLLSWIWQSLAMIGTPLVAGLAGVIRPWAPTLAALLSDSIFTGALGVLCLLVLIYLVGWFASKLIGRKMLTWLDRTLDRLPLIAQIHGAIRKTLDALQQQPKSGQRVVLIPFPSEQMLTVGLVTKLFRDVRSGREVAAVYVPTTPNPTSGYLEIVPVEQLRDTGWSVDQAMTFIISGGTVGPDELPFDPDRSGPQAPG